MKFIGIAILALFGLMAIGAVSMGLRVLFFPATVATNMIDTAYDANRQIINADNAIYNYEWFKQKKADIDASKSQLDIAKRNNDSYVASLGDRSTWGFEEKGEVARLNAVVLGIENNIQNQIQDYNARANMATRNIFEDHVLPNYIDALTFIRK